MGWGKAMVAVLGAAAMDWPSGFASGAVSTWGSPKAWATVRRRRPGKRKPWRVAKGGQGKAGGTERGGRRRTGRGGKR